MKAAFLALSLLVGLLSVSCARPGSELAPSGLAPGSARGANFLLITLDTTRADRLGGYGRAGARTPNLDRLGRSGIRFDRAIATAPVTLASHASILTGLYPPNHGVRNNAEFALAPAQLTLAEVLQANGYDTVAFVSSFVLDRRYGLDQGFARYDDELGRSPGSTFPSGIVERSGSKTTDAFLAWLAERKTTADRRPFFAWVHLFDAHAPYQPPPKFLVDFASRPYEGEIAAVDEQVGRLLDALHESDATDSTVITALADHGESLGEHGEETHSIFIYDSVVRVPWLLAAPGRIQEPQVIERAVSTVDLVPTVLDLLGLPDPARRDGLSLISQLSPEERAVYTESLVPWLEHGWAPLHALSRDHDKFIRAPRSEFYDLDADPGETKNLEGSGSDLVRSARRVLATELAARLKSWPPLAAVPERALDAEERSRLAALGYILGRDSADTPATEALRDPKDMIDVATALSQANLLAAAGRLTEAVDRLERARLISPKDRRVLQVLGKLYLQAGEMELAESRLREFTQIQPKSDVSLLLAQIAILRGRYVEAAGLLDQAARLEPRHGGIAIARGDLALAKGNAAEAAAWYRRAITEDPGRALGMAEARLARLPRQGHR